MSTTIIRILGKAQILYEGELCDGRTLVESVSNKLNVGEDYPFTVYLREGGKLLFVAIMRLESKDNVRLRMTFHQGRPEHLCKIDSLSSNLLKLASSNMPKLEAA